MNVRSNAKQVSDAWLKVARDIEPEMRKATEEATRLTWAAAKKEMRTLIYNKEIPRRPRSGKPQWRRTGNLRRSEKYRMMSAYIGVIYNDANYAEYRHDMGNPKYSKRKTEFPAPWRDNAVKKTARGRLNIYKKHLKRLIKSGRVQGVKL